MFKVLTTKKYVPSNKLLLSQDINNKLEEKDDYSYQYVNISEEVINKKCETIHIGIVCTGNKPILYLMTLLKSIYFYRNNPLHFHIMVNKISDRALNTLFDTWAVPQGSVNF